MISNKYKFYVNLKMSAFLAHLSLYEIYSPFSRVFSVIVKISCDKISRMNKNNSVTTKVFIHRQTESRICGRPRMKCLDDI